MIVCCAFVGGADGKSAAVRCSLWAAPTGADTDAGTRAKPFATVAKLARSLAPGQTGCLVQGSSFPTREVITAVGSRKARVTITTGPGGPRAVLLNGIETTQASRYLTLTNLAIGATNGVGAESPAGTVMMRGYSTALTNSDVGPGTMKDGGRSCVVLDHAGSALIHGNVLHQCNGINAQSYGAGVLAATSAGARISDNVIFGNAGGDGIALSPNAQVSVASGNLIVDNLGGIYFGGDAKTASRGNRIEQNVITRSRQVRRPQCLQPRSADRITEPRPTQLSLEPTSNHRGRHGIHDARQPHDQPSHGPAEATLRPRALEPL